MQTQSLLRIPLFWIPAAQDVCRRTNWALPDLDQGFGAVTLPSHTFKTSFYLLIGALIAILYFSDPEVQLSCRHSASGGFRWRSSFSTIHPPLPFSSHCSRIVCFPSWLQDDSPRLVRDYAKATKHCYYAICSGELWNVNSSPSQATHLSHEMVTLLLNLALPIRLPAELLAFLSRILILLPIPLLTSRNKGSITTACCSLADPMGKS
jgi:hypothetical protein